MKDFYNILGTDANCTDAEIKEAYKKLSKKFHADMNQGEPYSEAHFKEVNKAYETLIDPFKRGRYDASLKKTKLTRRIENPKKQAYYFKTKRVDLTFSIILVLITFVFGYYVYRSINGTKKPVVAKQIVAVEQPVIKHHKKKHLKLKATTPPPLITQTESKPAKVIADTPVKHFVPVHPTIPIYTVNTPVKTISKPIVADNIESEDNAPQTAYIKSNVTGVVYMRQADNYGSTMVTAIPSNSKVFVLDKGKTFCRISFNNQTGYVPKWTLQAK
jgi:hypothetical protein